MEQNELSALDRFQIFEQLQLHQFCIDNDASRESAEKYTNLYWPEGKMTTNDIKNATFEGHDGLKMMYDYAHSVFPIHLMRHSMGAFKIDGGGNEATVQWYWIVSWRESNKGTLSTGIYNDIFQKRGNVWKCTERVSNIDKNWPAPLFQAWINGADLTFKAS